MSHDPVLIRVLVATYPRSFRRRYGDELAGLLVETLGPARRWRRVFVVADVLRGMLDARLSSSGGIVMARSSLSAAVWAAGLFTVAGIGFQKVTEDQAGTGRTGTVTAAFVVLVGSAGLALAALVVAAAPTAVALVKRRGGGVVPLLAVPPVAVALWSGLVAVATRIADGRPVHSVAQLVAVALVAGGGIGVVAATAGAASSVLRRVDPGFHRWRAPLVLAQTVGMGLATVACLGWGLALRAADAHAFTDRDGLVATPLGPSWMLILVAIMGAATVLAGTSIRRSRAVPAS